MSRNIAIFVLVGLSLCNQIIGLVAQNIDELYPLQVSFSKNAYNRIVVEDGSVRRIVAQEGLFDIELDNITGQAFVTIREQSNGPLALSVITDSGSIQDIEIEATIKSPEVVLLREKAAQIQESLTEEEKAVQTISAVLSGERPEGYVQGKNDHYEGRNYGMEALRFNLQAVYEGPYDRVFMFNIVNQSSIECRLKEKHLARPQDSWVYLLQEKFSPGQSSKCIICQRKS